MSVAYVASISRRGIERKLKQEQKKWKKRKREEESFATNPTSGLISKLTAPDDRDDLPD